jgi:hypothetical protein
MNLLEKEKDYKSLGGWLMALQVFILLNGISWLRYLQLYFGLLSEKDKLISDMHISTPAVYTSFIYFEITSAVVMLLFTVALIYYMFRMAKLFKLLMILYVSLEVVLEFAVYFIFGSMLQSIGSLPVEKMAFTVVIAGMIVYYILKSERVKLTFIK